MVRIQEKRVDTSIAQANKRCEFRRLKSIYLSKDLIGTR